MDKPGEPDIPSSSSVMAAMSNALRYLLHYYLNYVYGMWFKGNCYVGTKICGPFVFSKCNVGMVKVVVAVFSRCADFD